MNYYDILLAKKLEDDRDPRVEGLSVTENGRYEEDGVVYKPVIVSVAPPEDSYQLKSITTPTSLATFEASAMPMPSLKVSVEAKQEGSGVPSPENVRPISGWSEVKVSDYGKNLFNPATVTFNKGIDSTGQIVGSSTSLVSDYIPIKPNMNYYLTCYNDDGNRRTNFYDSEKNFISTTEAGQGSRTFITPTNASYCIVSIGKTNYEDAQLEIGTSATDFEPYNPDSYTTTISLGQTVYGAEVDVVNGTSGNKLKYGFWELTADTNKWKKSSNYQGSFYYYDNEIVPYAANTPFICSHAECVNGLWDYVKGKCVCDGSLNFWLMDANATVEDWCDYITAQKNAGTPITIRYKLATPTTFTTQPTPIKSLEGTNNLSVDCGEVIEGEYFIEL